MQTKTDHTAPKGFTTILLASTDADISSAIATSASDGIAYRVECAAQSLVKLAKQLSTDYHLILRDSVEAWGVNDAGKPWRLHISVAA